MKMKLLIVLVAGVAALLWVRGQRAKFHQQMSGAASVEWMTNAAAAFERAGRENKTVLMDFTGSDWCGWCIRLDKEVFSSVAFDTYAKKNLVLLKLDFPRGLKQTEAEKQQNQALSEKYRIAGFPTIVVARADGTERGRLGYEPGGPEKWLASLKKIP